MIGRKAEAVLNRAVRYAVEHDHEYFTLEHVLWSLLSEAPVVQTVRACGGDSFALRKEIEVYLEAETPKLKPKETKSGGHQTTDPEPSVDSADPDFRSEDPYTSSSEGAPDHPVATLSIQRLIQRALFHVQSAGKDEIQPIDLFVAIFQAKDSRALHLLLKQGIERLDVLNFISHGVRKDTAAPQSSEEEGEGEGSQEYEENSEGAKQGRRLGMGTQKEEDPLSLYTLNLNDRAKAGKIDPLVGRQLELDRMIQTLCRRRKNNPLLVGEAGVGKTALAEGLALRVIENKVPKLLEKALVYALDMGSLMAGTKFRGDFEGRLKKIFSALEKKHQSGSLPILLIDEIHTIVGAGAVSGGALDAANLLKPVLTQGEIRCIGSTTYPEFRNIFEKDHALARRFQKIDVIEPTTEEAIQILSGLKSKFEDHHQVIYSTEAIRAAVELSAKHLNDRFLPDKAIDVIDEAGARARLRMQASPESAAPKPGEEAPRLKIGQEEIEEVIAQIARIPARSVSTSQKARLKSLDRDLKLALFGQDHAIDALVTAIRLARSGLRTGERPVGSFLFCGPTGVGKTELSKQLSHSLGVPFLRFDMSEYGEKHTVSRLIGAPPGYVGFEQAGLLTDAVLKTPHSVILLDEIEKAHADIWNILLQVMDHGVLTDNNGRKADFKNSILIMTSNVGSREMERRQLGLSGMDGIGRGASQKAVEQAFSPEFRNRLDAIVYFNPLDPITVGQVVGKQLMELESQLLARQVEVDVGSDVREWLAHKGYDRQMGARPLARLIQDKVKRPLSEEILFGKLEFGGQVRVFMKPSAEKSETNTREPHQDDLEVAYEVTSSRPEPEKRNEFESQQVSSENHHG
jgi:ATP-dependent Clp protease ATP-binding subunit ClpA